MSKRYREPIEDVEVAVPAVEGRGPAVEGRGPEVVERGFPRRFRWRGQRYTVTQVLGHWREDEGWWRGPDGEPSRIEQSDLWRVSAHNGTPTEGVYELVLKGGEWRLDRVWD